MQACPYYDTTKPVCCLEDHVAILKYNFAVIDAVFGHDVPLCAVNMKKFYCEIACNPNKANYVNATGMVK